MVSTDDLAEMSDEERQAHFEERRAELESVADEALELTDEERAALEHLNTDPDTATVELTGGIEVEVITHLPADVEESVDEITAADAESGLSHLRPHLVNVLSGLIVTEPYDSENVWRLYISEYGVSTTLAVAFRVISPALEALQDAADSQSFRTNR
jgi:hypothetical protein